MAIKLTSTEINKKYYLKPQEKPLQIKLHVPNLYLMVSKIGTCTFKFRLYMAKDGALSWIKLGNHPRLTVSEAVALAHDHQSKRDSGINPIQEKRELEAKDIKFNDFITSYLELNSKVNKLADSTTQSQSYLLAIVREKLGNLKLQDITASIIFSKLIKDYITDNKLAMANRFRIKLRQIFALAVKQELLLKNPIDNMDSYYQPKNAQSRNLHLTVIELKEFINCLYRADIITQIKYYVHLIIILGVRKSELMNVTWDMIDFDNAIFNNYQIKTKKINKIPLSKQAIKLLHRLKELNSLNDSYIVVNTNTRGKNQPVAHSYFNRVLDGLEFNQQRERQQKISPHDFRRVLSTLANESELFAPIDIEMALGHETRSGTEKHYNNSTAYLNRKRAVFEWIANKVDSLIDDDIDVYNLLAV